MSLPDAVSRKFVVFCILFLSMVGCQGGDNDDGNNEPQVNAGADQEVEVGVTVQLDGAGSRDPDGDALTYNWTLTAPAGSVASLSNAQAAQPTFVVDVPGRYTAELIVSDGNLSSAADTVTIVTPHVTVTGVADDGALMSPLGEAVCRVIDLSGEERARATTDVDGMYSMQVETGLQGFLLCHLPGLSSLTLTTFISTQDEPAGGRLEQEDVNPATTVVAMLSRARMSDEPLRVKTELLADWRAGRQPMALLGDVATILFNRLKDNGLNVDYNLALTDVFSDGDLDQAVLRDVVQEVQEAIGAIATGAEIARGFVRLASVGRACGDHCEPEESGEDSDGADTSDGGVEGDADDGTETSPIAFAVCRYVSHTGAIVAMTVADGEGRFFFPLDPAPEGFVECHPPALPQLVLSTFVRQGAEGERIVDQDVQPDTTLVSRIVSEFRRAVPDADLSALKANRLEAIEGRGDSTELFEANITLLAGVATELFNRMLEAGLDVNFRSALEDLFADSALDASELELIASQINQFVAEEEQSRGVEVDVASTTGAIEGRVTQGNGGGPAPGVTVIATQGGEEVQRTETGDDGDFSFENIPRGQTIIFVESASANQVDTTVVAIASVTANIEFVLANVGDIEVDANGDLLVLDFSLKGLFRVDRLGQMIEEVSGVNRGSGPSFLQPSGLAQQGDGAIWVVDRFPIKVFRVDPSTGNRTIVSATGDGMGPDFAGGSEPDIAVDADGVVWVVGSEPPAVVRVDPDTGARIIVSDADTGEGALFQRPLGVVVEASGELFVVDAERNAVVGVDPSNGDRRIVSDNTTAGDGTPFFYPRDIAIAADSALVIADWRGNGSLVLVDPMTGNRSIVSEQGLAVALDCSFPEVSQRRLRERLWSLVGRGVLCGLIR